MRTECSVLSVVWIKLLHTWIENSIPLSEKQACPVT